jgi:hypothetical protein
MKTDTPGTTIDSRVTLVGLAPRAFIVLGLLGIFLLAAGAVLGWRRGDDLRYFLHSYLVQFCFYLSLSLGALFFIAIQHVTRAGWSVTVRRIAEVMAGIVAVMAVLFLPILIPMLLGNHALYEWLNPELAKTDHLLQHKAPYLNLPFFLARCAVYFGFWWLAARFFLNRSVEQDATGEPRLTLRMERWSGPIILLFALTVTFAAFDWIMSLEYYWFSTMFGVYYFSGAIVGATAAMILAAIVLQSTGRLTDAINVEHYHDLGKLLFAFVVFWGYIAFSQYMLIWYGNVPEETTWYLHRQSGPWTAVSLLLLAGHLLIPFFGLLSREAKRRRGFLAFWAAWVLLFHWLDIYWLIMPSVELDDLPLGLVDACLMLGMGCIYIAGFVWVAGSNALVPLRDPRLGEAQAFENI